MIESLIENDLTLKRWRRFKNRRTAYFSLFAVLSMFMITMIAPMLANSKPLYLSYKGTTYFPVLKDYHPRDFGINDLMVIDYRNMKLSEDDSVIWPMYGWNPFEINSEVESFPSPPTETNIMGTDESGRDVFSRVLYGFKYSFIYAACVTLISFTAGTLIGGAMGFYGGRIDMIGQRMIEIWTTIPVFYLLLILISVFTPSLLLLIAITTLFDWTRVSYYSRGEFLKNRKREFVEAARACGGNDWRVIVKHILPNSLTPIITFAPFSISGHIMSLASLDYLGFGLPIPTPSWGELLAQAQKHFTTSWWLAVYPSLALFITLLLLNLIGEGVRDAMDPNANL